MNTSELMDSAAKAIKWSTEAANGLLVGVDAQTIDRARLSRGRAALAAADAACHRGDWRKAEREAAWARHYARTCGAPMVI